MTKQTVFTEYKNALTALLEEFDANEVMRENGLSIDEIPYHIRNLLEGNTGVCAEVLFVGYYPSPNANSWTREVYAITFDGNVFYIGTDSNGWGDDDGEVYLLNSYAQEDFKQAADKAKEDAFKSDLLLVCINDSFII